MKTLVCSLLGLFVLATGVQAASTTYYLTHTGTGLKDGSSWAHAFSGSSLPAVVN